MHTHADRYPLTWPGGGGRPSASSQERHGVFDMRPVHDHRRPAGAAVRPRRAVGEGAVDAG